MKSLSKYLIAFLCLTFLWAGKPVDKKSCQTLPAGFITNGRDYKVKFTAEDPAKAYFSFFTGYTYHLSMCSQEIKKYKVEIFDIEKKILFSGNCEDYAVSWDFSFQATMACFAVITPLETVKKDSNLIISLAFKEQKAGNN